MKPENRVTWETASPEETLALGEALGRSLVPGLTAALIGALGAGKTHLTKGIALGNGIADTGDVTSPTFTLVNEYPGKLRLFHLDAYRLSGERELHSLGFDEFLSDGDAAVVVEWADRVRAALPEDTLWIELRHAGLSARTIQVTAAGERSLGCLFAMREGYR